MKWNWSDAKWSAFPFQQNERETKRENEIESQKQQWWKMHKNAPRRLSVENCSFLKYSSSYIHKQQYRVDSLSWRGDYLLWFMSASAHFNFRRKMINISTKMATSIQDRVRDARFAYTQKRSERNLIFCSSLLWNINWPLSLYKNGIVCNTSTRITSLYFLLIFFLSRSFEIKWKRRQIEWVCE